jgi:hypothetical protein
MSLAVIRADLPAPILLADLEQVSRRNDPVEAPGQEQYLSLPTAAEVAAALADASTGVGATITASAAPTSLTIGSGNRVLRLRTSSTASFVAYSIALATYATTDALIVAINAALAGSGIHAFKAGVAEEQRVVDADRVPAREQLRHQHAADVARAAGDQHARVHHVLDTTASRSSSASVCPTTASSE